MKKFCRYFYIGIVSCVLSIFVGLSSCGDGVTEKDSMYCQALLDSAEVEFQRNDILTSTTHLTEARQLAKRNDWQEMYHAILNRMARNFSAMGDDDEAMSLMESDVEFVREHLGGETIRQAMNNYGILLTNNGNIDKARILFQQLYEDAQVAGDSSSMGCAASNLSHIARLNGCADSALFYAERAMQSFPRKDTVQILLATMGKVYYDMDCGRYVNAGLLIDSLLLVVDSAENTGLYHEMMRLRGKAFMEEGLYGIAADYIAVSAGGELTARIEAYRILRELYRRKGDLTVSLAYGDSLIWAEDSLNRKRNLMVQEQGQMRFNYFVSKAELKEKNVTLRYGTVILLLFLVTVIIAGITVRLKLRHDKERYQMTEKDKRIAELELETMTEQKKRLELELETTNRELATNVLHLSNRNRIIRDTLDYLSTLPGKHGHATYVMQLKAQLHNDTEIEDSLRYFEKVNTHFITALHERHPDLTANDVRYISYVYMQLSTKEIASLLNISPVASRKRKQRICEKMGISDNETLYSYITGI